MPAFPYCQQSISVRIRTTYAAMTPRKSTRKSTRPAVRKTPGESTRRWSARVTRTSDALDLDQGVFTWKDPKRIAGSLKRTFGRA